jgi:hypothetical protein
VVDIDEGKHVWSYSFSVLDSGMVGRGNSNRHVRQFQAFQAISSTKFRLSIYEGCEVSMGVSELVPKHFLEKYTHKSFEFVLKSSTGVGGS